MSWNHDKRVAFRFSLTWTLRGIQKTKQGEMWKNMRCTQFWREKRNKCCDSFDDWLSEGYDIELGLSWIIYVSFFTVVFAFWKKVVLFWGQQHSIVSFFFFWTKKKWKNHGRGFVNEMLKFWIPEAQTLDISNWLKGQLFPSRRKDISAQQQRDKFFPDRECVRQHIWLFLTRQLSFSAKATNCLLCFIYWRQAIWQHVKDRKSPVHILISEARRKDHFNVVTGQAHKLTKKDIAMQQRQHQTSMNRKCAKVWFFWELTVVLCFPGFAQDIHCPSF